VLKKVISTCKIYILSIQR